MLTKKEIQILASFTPNIFLPKTYAEIKCANNITSNSFLQKAIKQLAGNSFLTTKTTGKTKTYYCNTSNFQTIAYLEMHTFDCLPKEIQISIANIQKALVAKNIQASILLFGSLAKKKNTENSDVDLAIISSKGTPILDLKIACKSAKNKELVPLDIQIFTSKEFETLLDAPYENVAKQIVSANLPISGTALFYYLLESKLHYEKIIFGKS